MSAQETVVAVAAGTGAAVVAKTINTNKLADTLSKTRKTRWFRWVDINVPNDFAEADAHQADPNIIANASTLETLGKLVTVGYVQLVSRAVPCRDRVTEPGLEAPWVAVHREDSIKLRPAQPTEKTDEIPPPSASAPQEVLHRRHHGAVPDGVLRDTVHGVRGRLQALELRGLQQVPRHPAHPARTSPFSNFASASVEMNPTCEWVIQDLIGYARERACPGMYGNAILPGQVSGQDAIGQCNDLSTCRSAGQLPLCKATDESCKQSNQTIEWILQEFRNTPVSSTELLAQDTLENLANQTFESAIKLGSLISTTPVKTVEAWASANVPGLETMAERGQEAMSFAQGIMDVLKNFTRILLRGNAFDNATAAEKAIYMDAVYERTYFGRWNNPMEPEHDLDEPRNGDEFSPFVTYGRESDERGKYPKSYYGSSACDGVYWETYTEPTPATDYMEINEMLNPLNMDPSDAVNDPCLQDYRECYYDCSFNGQTFTDWDGDYANIPSWVPYDKTQNNGDLHWQYQTMQTYPYLHSYRGYTMPGLTCTKTREGPLWRNKFERNTQGDMPPPPWPEYEFNQSGTWGCDAYSVALDTTYFLYDTPERFLLIKNASWDAMDKNLKDKAKAAGKPEPQFDGWGPGSGIDYVAKFAVPIMKRHGTVRNAISNLFIDEKVVSVNYEVSDPVFDLSSTIPPHRCDSPPELPPVPPTPGLLQHMRHHHVHVHVQCTTLDRGAHVGHLRPHRRYRRLHEPLRRLRLRRL